MKGGIAAEMQSAAAKLHAAIEQASNISISPAANSAANATSNENRGGPLVTITETVDADTLIKHAADVKVSIIDPHLLVLLTCRCML